MSAQYKTSCFLLLIYRLICQKSNILHFILECFISGGTSRMINQSRVKNDTQHFGEYVWQRREAPFPFGNVFTLLSKKGAFCLYCPHLCNRVAKSNCLHCVLIASWPDWVGSAVQQRKRNSSLGKGVPSPMWYDQPSTWLFQAIAWILALNRV